MRRLTWTVLVTPLLLACEPSTNGIVEVQDSSSDDEIGTDSESESESESSSESADDLCEVGTLGCACTPGGSCDPGLECTDGLCSDPDETETDTDTPCTALGCACDDSEGSCDRGLECSEGVCTIDYCGNGALDPNEQCDDGNSDELDGCDNDCSYTEVLSLAAGGRHTCAVIEGGALRCWGEATQGQLGYGNASAIGDNEHPNSIDPVPLPGPVVRVYPGEAHTCAMLDDGLRCWGQNYYGQLGYGVITPLLGDDEPIDMLGPVNVGGPVAQHSAGGRHNCARLEDGKVRCWGAGDQGQLGLGNTDTIGNDEEPAAAQSMVLGKLAMQVASGTDHSCVITIEGKVRCWGRGNSGQLGYANNQNIGDNETPNIAGDISLIPASLPAQTIALGLALGAEHSCALLDGGHVLCWGRNDQGQLATGSNQNYGDGNDELPSNLVPIPLGGPAIAIAAGGKHSCALLEGGAVRCWGENNRGQLGLGNTDDVGIDETPAEVGPVELGKPAIAITAGSEHTCALLVDHRVICWGYNPDGRLGYANTQTIGDNEPPVDAMPVELW